MRRAAVLLLSAALLSEAALSGFASLNTFAAVREERTAYLEELLRGEDLPYDVMIKFRGEGEDLKAVAEEAQAEAMILLQTAEREGRVESYESFYIANGIHLVTESKELIREIAQLPNVEKVTANERVALIQPIKKKNRERRSTGIRSHKKDNTLYLPEGEDIEWGVLDVHADKVWSEFQITGAGVTVGIIDSGVNYNLPALKKKFKDYDPVSDSVLIKDKSEAAYRDFVSGSSVPARDPVNDHGTHVAGTILGNEENGVNRIGVAPGARFISARALSEDGGNVDDLLRAAEWMLEQHPDVINNSWGGEADADIWFKPVVDAWVKAGIIPVFAAGNTTNQEPGLGTISNPGNYMNVISVAAVDHDKRIGRFSNKGPSAFDPDGTRCKPELSAPGVKVRSVDAMGNYVSWDGTSMAAPHVVGVIALIREAAKKAGRENEFDELDEIRNLLTSTAEPLKDASYPDFPNMAYGYGLVNAYDAVARIMGREQGSIYGTVLRDGKDSQAPTAELLLADEGYLGRDILVKARLKDDISITSARLFYYFNAEKEQQTEGKMQLTEGEQNDGIYTFLIDARKLKRGALHLSLKVTDYAGTEIEKTAVVQILPGMSLPWTQNFENADASLPGFLMDGCWKVSEKRSDAEPELPSSSGGEENRFYVGTDAGQPDFRKRVESYIYLPPIDLSNVEVKATDPKTLPSLSLDMFNDFTGISHASIEASLTGKEGEWKELYRVVLRPDITERSWEHKTLSLGEYAGKNTPLQIRCRFYGHLMDKGSGWYLDNLSVKVGEDAAPAAPEGLRASVRPEGLLLQFIANEESDLAHYDIERSDDRGLSFRSLASIQQDKDAFEFIEKDIDKKHTASHYRVSFTDTTAISGQHYIYRVRAVDTTGNVSGYSKTLALDYESYARAVFYNFESGDEGFQRGTVSGSVNDWQRGVLLRPENFDELDKLFMQYNWNNLLKNKSHVWGTNLKGKISNGQDSYLQSPVIHVPDRAWLYFDSFNCIHGLTQADFRVDVRRKGDAIWMQLISREEIMEESRRVKWTTLGASLKDYAEQDIELRFSVHVQKGIYLNVYDFGWYIDNVCVGEPTKEFEAKRLLLSDVPEKEGISTASNAEKSSASNAVMASASDATGAGTADVVGEAGESEFADGEIINDLVEFAQKQAEKLSGGKTGEDEKGFHLFAGDFMAASRSGSPEKKKMKPGEQYVPLRAKVKVLETGKYSYTSEIDGSYRLNHAVNAEEGLYTVQFSAYGYQTEERHIDISGGDREINLGEVVLKRAKTAALRGMVTDAGGSALSGVSIRLVDDPLVPVIKSAEDGSFRAEQVYEGEYTLRFFKEGYRSIEKDVTLKSGEENVLDAVQLIPLGALETETTDYGYSEKKESDGKFETIHFTSGIKGMAVRFQSPHKGGILKSADILTVQNDVFGGENILIAVLGYNETGRLVELAPFRAYPGLRANAWSRVDFSEFTISTDQPLYIASMYQTPKNESMGIHYDKYAEARAKAHSYIYDGYFLSTNSMVPSGAYAVKANWLYEKGAERNPETDEGSAGGSGGDTKPIVVPEQSAFVFDPKTQTITKYLGFDTEVAVPAGINGVAVRRIGAEAFIGTDKGDRKLRAITLPEGIEEIGENAFKNNNLSRITLPESLRSIGRGAFMFQYKDGMEDKSLKLSIPSGVRFIEENTFESAGSPLIIERMDGVTEIRSGAFRGVREVELHAAQLKVLAEDAFGNHPDFPYAHIYTAEDSPLASKNGQYLVNPALVELTLVDGRDHEKIFRTMTVYGSDVNMSAQRKNAADSFYRTGQEVQIRAPKLTVEGRQYRCGDSAVRMRLDRKNGLRFDYYLLETRLREPLFVTDTELPGFAVPNAELTLRFEEEQYTTRANADGFFLFLLPSLQEGDVLHLQVNGEDAGKATVRAQTGGDAYIIENGKIVRYTGEGGALTLPVSAGNGERITEIGDFAFYGKALSEVVLPDALKTIGRAAFMNTGLRHFGWQLQDINTAKLVTINEYAFRNNALTALRLPELTHVLRDGAFENNQLASLELGRVTGHLGARVFKNNKLREVELPARTEEIGEEAFMNNLLGSVRVNPRVEGYTHGLEEIPARAFAGNRLTELALPRTVTKVSELAFLDNTKERFLVRSDAPSVLPTGGYDVLRSDGTLLKWKPGGGGAAGEAGNPEKPQKKPEDKPGNTEGSQDKPGSGEKPEAKPGNEGKLQERPGTGQGGRHGGGGGSRGARSGRTAAPSAASDSLRKLPQGYTGATKQIGNIIVPASVLNTGVWESVGTEGKTWGYRSAAGALLKNGWYEIYSPAAAKVNAFLPYAWYCFDENGQMRSGFYTDAQGNSYLFSEAKDALEGIMLTGWQKRNGKWYYFTEYYGRDMGKMLRNTVTPDGYRLLPDGSWDGAVR